MFFSVIITTYNRVIYLKETLRRLEVQTFKNFEVIVVDDCSKDNTREWIEQFKLESELAIQFLQTPANSGGPALPRNIGLLKAVGQWICFCDSDDYFYENHLLTYYDFIIKNKIKHAVLSSNALRDGRDVFLKNMSSKEVSLFSNFRSSKFIFSSICIDNNSLISFKEDKELVAIEDYFFMLENMDLKRKHYFINENNVYYSDDSEDSIRKSNPSGYYVWKPQLGLYLRNRLYFTRYVGLLLITLIWYSKFVIKTYFYNR